MENYQDKPERVAEAKPSFAAHNWIALTYTILAGITLFNTNEGLAGALFLAMGVVGVIAGFKFAVKMSSLGKANAAARVFMIIVGIGGGIVIFVIAGIIAVIGVFKNMSFGGF